MSELLEGNMGERESMLRFMILSLISRDQRVGETPERPFLVLMLCLGERRQESMFS